MTTTAGNLRSRPGEGAADDRHGPPTARLELRALGRFAVTIDEKPVAGLESRRVQELLTFIELNHERVFARDALAETLWGERLGDPRKTLRQVLWQAHSAFATALGAPVLAIENGFIGLHREARMHSDIVAIEVAHRRAHDTRTGPLDDTLVASLREAASNYRGDLLPNCDLDWCLVERERFKAMYLAILETLMINAEAVGNLGDGLWYGEQVLRHDRASERTHRRLMTLRYLSGDPTGAMRQYESCVRALAEELAVDPGPATRELDGMIRRGEPPPQLVSTDRNVPVAVAAPATAGATDAARGADDPVTMLRDAHSMLRAACDQVERALAAFGETTADDRKTLRRQP